MRLSIVRCSCFLLRKVCHCPLSASTFMSAETPVACYGHTIPKHWLSIKAVLQRTLSLSRSETHTSETFWPLSTRASYNWWVKYSTKQQKYGSADCGHLTMTFNMTITSTCHSWHVNTTVHKPYEEKSNMSQNSPSSAGNSAKRKGN